MNTHVSTIRPAEDLGKYADQIYAGVLGKLIGVYLGRAVEGWSYEAIRERFDEIDYYVADKVGWPLIVPDDDISGTFLFYRALEDNGYPTDIKSKAIGDTWLNHIIEDKTVLWWGGLGRSTEHTAYLRLKEGIDAPRSGSAELNSRAMAEAIGSEIFIDTWALSNPANPDRAAYMAREAAAVSHDGIAIEAAVLLAAMEAAAFEETGIDALLDLGLRYNKSDELARIIGDLRNQCAKANHWREVRDWLEQNHSYGHYPGCCPMVPNHTLLLASFILGGDDVQKGLSIAVSSGWDTDCNAGNLACLNGIRLGLPAFEQGPDFRGPVADRLYVVGADGGDCMSDAVIETRKIRATAAALNGESYDAPAARFAWEYPGAVQGWELCPLHDGPQAILPVKNANETGDGDGLLLRYDALARGVSGSVSVRTFIEPKPLAASETSYFEVLASPSIYESQTVTARVTAFSSDTPELAFFVIYYDGDGKLTRLDGEPIALKKGDNDLTWKVPSVGGLPIQRIGLSLTSDRRVEGRIAVRSMDWSGAPEAFVMGGAFDLSPNMSPFDTSTYWLKSFVSSALHFRPDVDTTFALSHPGKLGLATTGTRDWDDYSATAWMTMDLHETAGVVVRSRGHRRFYAGILAHGKVQIIRQWDADRTVLAEAPFDYAENQTVKVTVRAEGRKLTLLADDTELTSAECGHLASGGAGFLIEGGTIPTRGFEVRAFGKGA
ncbi:ADP-ribosylglycohydrolase family protein [Pelagovum pacificum]|uniref:ADP-ribosylglycohydrolase family protein n=1 Tax=Pelagovum pacificum TaxID=2588711 RepID=A0A5C5G8I6_9RHOB|nr:ADP-ribosylglycohydrolase family protein [Pelagovum pacificum]QQA41766.1 ADP-ribosylglycohydrolase family protein [Pelagovum pacificum]TNY31039.1 ADP-ribosylglycohydrolase family protein [Pelagovum pacificum]